MGRRVRFLIHVPVRMRKEKELYLRHHLIFRRRVRANQPELLTEEWHRTVMTPPPRPHQVGGKKTVFPAFMDLCKVMHRQPDQVMDFFLGQLCTSGSLDGQQRLVVKGKFGQKMFESILGRYLTKYVICGACRSPDTVLSKENSLTFMRCKKCGVGFCCHCPVMPGPLAPVWRRNVGG